MDPLDQRLSDAGTAWRQSQPEPPDLDRLVRGLDRRTSRVFSPRLAFVVVAGLVLVSALAVAGVGGGFNGFQNGIAVTPTTSPAPTRRPAPTSTSAARTAQVPITPAPKTPVPAEPTSQPNEGKQAAILLDGYERALVAGEWQTAFDMLSPSSPTRKAGISAYAAEREPYFKSVAGRYTVGAPTRPADWTTYAPLIEGADTSRAYLIEVDYPALSGNNAGYEQFVVAPDAAEKWWIWPVR
jgi:hypothetical protein